MDGKGGYMKNQETKPLEQDQVSSEADDILRSERFRHGLAVYTHMTANAYDGGLNPALMELTSDFPFLVYAAMSFGIGEVAKTRELAMIAALAALGRDGYPQLRLHVRYALNFGATPAELREIAYITMVTAGLPKALNVASEIRAAANGMPVERSSRADEGGDGRRSRGEASLRSLNGGSPANVAADPILGPLRDDFPLLVDAAVAFAYGDIWSRSVLDPVDCHLAAVAAYAAIGGDAWPQMRQHAGYALTAGATLDAVKEILNITIVSAGLPKALNAAVALRSILTNRS